MQGPVDYKPWHQMHARFFSHSVAGAENQQPFSYKHEQPRNAHDYGRDKTMRIELKRDL
jgi:hypothetical protein